MLLHFRYFIFYLLVKMNGFFSSHGTFIFRRESLGEISIYNYMNCNNIVLKSQGESLLGFASESVLFSSNNCIKHLHTFENVVVKQTSLPFCPMKCGSLKVGPRTKFSISFILKQIRIWIFHAMCRAWNIIWRHPMPYLTLTFGYVVFLRIHTTLFKFSCDIL